MVKRSLPDEISLDELVKESMKEMGKGEAKQEQPVPQQPTESTKSDTLKPQFGFKLGEVETPDSFVVAPKKDTKEQVTKKQIILDKPSQDLDDDIIVDW